MADFAYSQSEMDAAEEINSGGLQALINFTGGIVSIVLVAGLVAWGWQLLVRDVSGVPVVEALEGPMRVEPADPGGAQADHQGLAVNRIAEGQEAAPAADSIVLAPPPVALAEDRPTGPVPRAEAPLAAEEPAVAETLAVEEPAPQAVPETAAAPTAPTPEAAAEATLALIDQLITEETLTDRGEVLPISVAGLRNSLMPAPRPAALELAATPAATETEAAAPAEVEVTSLAAGTRLVQLGAFDDPEQARLEWDRLAAAYPEFFASRDRIVQEAVSGGRTFFRLRAHGFADLMDARRFCTALLAEGAACIPVTVR